MNRYHRTRGISLIYALLALAAMSLAAVALVRSAGGGSLVVGNLTFKQDATAASSRAAEQAIAWLVANAGVTLENDGANNTGYYATTLTALDATGTGSKANTRSVVDWGNNNCADYTAGTYGLCLKASAAVDLGNGNNARFVMMRQCSAQGSPASVAVDCASPLATSSSLGMNRGDIHYSTGRLAATTLVQYYRIVVRTQGPRNTVSFTETLVQL